jgi:hypothetical protein
MKVIVVFTVVLVLIITGGCQSVDPNVEEYLIKRMKSLSNDLDQIRSKYGDITGSFSFTNTSTGIINISMINAMINDIKIRLSTDPSLNSLRFDQRVYDTANITLRGTHNISQAFLLTVLPCMVTRYDSYGKVPTDHRCAAVYEVSNYLSQFKVSQTAPDLFEIRAFNTITLLKPDPHLAYQFPHGYPTNKYQLYPDVSYSFLTYRYTRVYENAVPKFYLSEFDLKPLDSLAYYIPKFSTNKNSKIFYLDRTSEVMGVVILFLLFGLFVYTRPKSELLKILR